MLRLSMAAFLATALVLAVGCSDPQTVDTSNGAPKLMEPASTLVAQPHPTVPDLPVPMGFSLDEARSRSSAAAGTRLVDYVYLGRSDKFAVGRFYKQQMPVNRWTMVMDNFAQGVEVLEFEKEGERCRITIDSTSNLLHPTQVLVFMCASGRVEQPVGDQRNLSKR